MDLNPGIKIDDYWIKSLRGKKNEVDPARPYAFLVEQERLHSGIIEDVLTVFLTNRECPFTCLMCDLWVNTTDHRVPTGTITSQLEWTLSRVPEVNHIKLYNSGNFFDNQAIPFEDHQQIAAVISGFKTVIIESHPKLINRKVLEFQDMLNTELQVAVGLETVHPKVLPLLNKRMELRDFEKSIRYLSDHGIQSRAFILLRPPFLNEEEGILWAKKSVDYAFECGVECCVVIPTRKGNGAMDYLGDQGYFTSPDIKSLEEVLDYGIGLKKGRVFADLWDIELFSSCPSCLALRIEKLENTNLQQQVFPSISCQCCA